MAARSDGEKTRRRILEAACHVFGQRGYREATNAEICRKAKANIAAINYHFGSKADLYRATWEHGAERANELYPLHGGVPESASAEERLAGVVWSLVSRRLDQKRLRYFHRIRMSEHANPTGLVDELVAKLLRGNATYVTGILHELLGAGATRDDIALCHHSLVSQCLFFVSFQPPRAVAKMSRRPVKDKGQLIGHVTRFCLAGVGAVRREIASR
jgi:AcrR family transcriptional regulator